MEKARDLLEHECWVCAGMGLQHPLGAYFECLELWSSREKERLDEMRLEREKWSSNTTTMGPYLLLTHEDETAIFSRGDTGITFSEFADPAAGQKLWATGSFLPPPPLLLTLLDNVVVSFLGLALLGIAVSSCFLTARAKRRSDAETEAISRNLAPAGEGGAGAGGGGGGGRRGDRDDGVGVIIVGRESVPQPPPSPQPQPPSPPPPFQPPPQWPPPPTYEEAMMQSRKE